MKEQYESGLSDRYKVELFDIRARTGNLFVSNANDTAKFHKGDTSNL